MIQAIRGTKDILPDSVGRWHFVEEVFRRVSLKYGYDEIRTPIFESTQVFSRSIGEGTDIVNKEMYTFTDKGGESLTLRPEQTASTVRSVIQNSLLHNYSTLRLWYFGPFFRFERPQKGRLRQFHQYGAECIGSLNSESDVEVILLANSIIKSLGIDDYRLNLNTLGNEQSRNNYRKELINFFQTVRNELSGDSESRLETNPLRILDSKDERDINLLTKAPVILDYLDNESGEHFESVKSSLDSLGIQYTIEPRLVRGLDYYSHTVFEFQSSALGSQDSFGGGGRYDSLFEQMEGEPTPAVGFAMGVERLLLIIEAQNKFQFLSPPKRDVYIIISDKEFLNYSVKIAEILRSKCFNVVFELQRRSIKAQFREANKMNARYSIIIGADEFQNNKVSIKNLNSGEQVMVDIDKLESYDF